jgi:hypothetical protein
MGRSVSPEVARERRGLVEQWEASGLSIAEFTRERGLAYQAFLARRHPAGRGQMPWGGRDAYFRRDPVCTRTSDLVSPVQDQNA